MGGASGIMMVIPKQLMLPKQFILPKQPVLT